MSILGNTDLEHEESFFKVPLTKTETRMKELEQRVAELEAYVKKLEEELNFYKGEPCV